MSSKNSSHRGYLNLKGHHEAAEKRFAALVNSKSTETVRVGDTNFKALLDAAAEVQAAETLLKMKTSHTGGTRVSGKKNSSAHKMSSRRGPATASNIPGMEYHRPTSRTARAEASSVSKKKHNEAAKTLLEFSKQRQTQTAEELRAADALRSMRHNTISE